MEERLVQLARIMERGFETLADLQRATNERLDATNERLDATNERLDGAITRLDRHEEVRVKLADGMVMLTGEVKDLNGRFDNFLTGTHQQEHGELRPRVERLERHLGLPEAQ